MQDAESKLIKLGPLNADTVTLKLSLEDMKAMLRRIEQIDEERRQSERWIYGWGYGDKPS